MWLFETENIKFLPTGEKVWICSPEMSSNKTSTKWHLVMFIMSEENKVIHTAYMKIIFLQDLYGLKASEFVKSTQKVFASRLRKTPRKIWYQR